MFHFTKLIGLYWKSISLYFVAERQINVGPYYLHIYCCLVDLYIRYFKASIKVEILMLLNINLFDLTVRGVFQSD